MCKRCSVTSFEQGRCLATSACNDMLLGHIRRNRYRNHLRLLLIVVVTVIVLYVGTPSALTPIGSNQVDSKRLHLGSIRQGADSIMGAERYRMEKPEGIQIVGLVFCKSRHENGPGPLHLTPMLNQTDVSCISRYWTATCARI